MFQQVGPAHHDSTARGLWCTGAPCPIAVREDGELTRRRLPAEMYHHSGPALEVARQALQCVHVLGGRLLHTPT
eukprot:3535534-Heterocapsa_arctica.AAC.1